MDVTISKLQTVYARVKEDIEETVTSFKDNRSRDAIRKELFFCLLTPQCRAQTCWENVQKLCDNKMLLSGDEKVIASNFKGIRFKNNKAGYIVAARESLFNGSNSFLKKMREGTDGFALREYVVSLVKGMGYKEASHFLRNIGKGEELAILDRHVLRGLVDTQVINEIPRGLSKSMYISTVQ